MLAGTLYHLNVFGIRGIKVIIIKLILLSMLLHSTYFYSIMSCGNFLIFSALEIGTLLTTEEHEVSIRYIKRV